MAYTLADLSKNSAQAGDYAVSFAYDLFAEESELLRALPINTIEGSGRSYRMRTASPGVGTRRVNEAFTESRGSATLVQETVALLGGTVMMDEFERRTERGFDGGDPLLDEMDAQARAVARQAVRLFFKGDSSVEPKEFDGYQKRLSDPTSPQVIKAKDVSPTNGGDPLTLIKLDQLKLAVRPRPTFFAMNLTMLNIVNQLIRSAGSAIETVDTQFGRTLPAYSGIPILVILEDENDNTILDFTEVGAGGSTATATSIYAMYADESAGVSLLQAGAPNVMPPVRSRSIWESTVEWYPTPWQPNPHAAARLYGLKNGVS